MQGPDLGPPGSALLYCSVLPLLSSWESQVSWSLYWGQLIIIGDHRICSFRRLVGLILKVPSLQHPLG